MSTVTILIGVTVILCLLNTFPLFVLIFTGERLRARSRAKWLALAIVTLAVYGVALVTSVTAIALMVSQTIG